MKKGKTVARYSLPSKTSTLGLSFKDVESNKRTATERFAFPSWRISMAYYSAYFFLRSITLQKQANLRLQEHSATVNSFKNNVLPTLSRVIWKFPFDISYTPVTRFTQGKSVIKQIPHLKHAYCSHPRPPQRLPFQLCKHVHQVFRNRGTRGAKSFSYTLFDYLHDFRVWANYLEIDNWLSLSGEGYKSFLDQNLSIILFFRPAIDRGWRGRLYFAFTVGSVFLLFPVCLVSFHASLHRAAVWNFRKMHLISRGS